MALEVVWCRVVGQRYWMQGLFSVGKTVFDFFLSLPTLVAIKVLFHNEHSKSEGI